MFNNKELTRCKHWSFMKASFNHKPWILQSGNFFVSILDFRQFTIDLSENNTVFFSFYVLHLAYTIVVLSHKLAILLMHSVTRVFSSIKQWSPNTNKSYNVNYQSTNLIILSSISIFSKSVLSILILYLLCHLNLLFMFWVDIFSLFF